MTGLSEARLAEIAAIEAAASKGPWLQGIDGYSVIGPNGGAFSDLQVSIDVGDPADAVFIADARTAVPELLAEVGRLKAEASRSRSRSGPRRDLLLATIQNLGGRWDVGRVKNMYAASSVGHVDRSNIRSDLQSLRKAGHLALHKHDGRQYYTLTGGAQ